MDLKFSHIATGQYPTSDKYFAGLNYLEITGALTHKTQKISMSNPTLYNQRDSCRVVDNPNDALSPYKLYQKIRALSHDSQEAVFCHDLSASKSKVLIEYGHGWEGVKYDPMKPLGPGTIQKFSKVVNRNCGIENYDDFSNHDWRTFMVTKLANDNTVSAVEQLTFSRHRSMDSARPYMRPQESASATFQRALQTENLPSSRSLVRAKKTTATKKPTKTKVDTVGGKLRVSARIASKKKTAKSTRKK